MAKKIGINEILLRELQEIKADVKEVRQKDIPSLREEFAVIKEKTRNSAKIIAGVGGAIAVLTSAAIAWLK